MRRPALLAAPVGLLLALSGCTAGPAQEGAVPIDTHVRTYTDLRRHYLDAVCPVNAWFAAGPQSSSRARADGVRLADAADSELAPVPKPWPDSAAPGMARLRSGAQRLAAALRTGETPTPLPSDAQAQLEGIVNVSAAAGSANCVGHPPTTSPG